MSHKRTFRDGWKNGPAAPQEATLLICALFLLVFPLGVWAQQNRPVNRKLFEHIYFQGRTVFYSTLEERISHIPVCQEDKNFLHKERYKKKGLFEHLMNFYFYLYDLPMDEEIVFQREFLKICGFMAEEFIQSIPLPCQNEGCSSLTSLLISSGYYFKSATPQLKKHLRPIGGKSINELVFQELQVNQAHSISKGKNTKIAIVDSGVDPSIKEIKGRIKRYKNLLDGSIPFAEKGSFPYDWNGHGTAVTSLVHQIAPKAELMIVKFYDRDTMKLVPPTIWTAYLAAAGMIWAAQNGADIINLSAAFLQDLWPIREAAKYCWERNVLVVTAMGNSFEETNESRDYFPARYPWTLAVGGTGKIDGQLKVWKHSGRGEYVDIVAPAKDLWVDLPSYLDKVFGAKMPYGNSLAVALVSGATALILAAMDEMVRSELNLQKGQLCEKVRDIVRKTASNEALGFSLPNPLSGFGLIGIHKAVLFAISHYGVKKPEGGSR